MALAFGGVVVRLVFVQGVSSSRYATFGQSQRVRAVNIPADEADVRVMPLEAIVKVLGGIEIQLQSAGTSETALALMPAPCAP